MGCEMKDYKRLTDKAIAEMLINTEGESWDSDNIEAQCYIRLAELEDKIERGELVEIPKGSVVLTPEERAEEMRLCNEERKQAVKEFAASVKLAFYYEFDELIPSIMADKIDALVKEECGKEKSND